MAEIDVKLQVFEGPLDLLLHLIDKNKIDIYDIPISEITDQNTSPRWRRKIWTRRVSLWSWLRR